MTTSRTGSSSGKAVTDGSIRARALAMGSDWAINEYVCRAGPENRPFEEQHNGFTIAAVVDGSFNYSSGAGAALLHAGTFLLGNHGHCYTCNHRHGRGDRCISLQIEPVMFSEIAAMAAGGANFRFPVVMLPAVMAYVPYQAEFMLFASQGLEGCLQVPNARLRGDELVFGYIEQILRKISAHPVAAFNASANDHKRISRVLRVLDATLSETQSLDSLAGTASMSKFHFLRTFRRVTGVTPYNYILGRRLGQAALQLRSTQAPVSDIAFDAGFGDLSTFNRHFRSVFGDSPVVYRRREQN